MNLLLFTEADRLDANSITVYDRRLQHLRQVHRASAGDTLRVGEIDGLMGEAEILTIGKEAAVLAVSLDQPPPPKLPLTLVLALPRPKMLRRILRNVAELGVAELHLINSYRVEKSYWQSPVLADATVREYLLQGLEQSRDTRLPRVHYHRRFKPFVEDSLPAILAEKHALLAQPGEYPPCPRVTNGECLLVIGPEGGFIPYEVTQLQDAGCEAVSLGARILRVENAVTSVLGRLF
ncbi:MAG: 16S rRNA (uracil(1498)-N(3))-methyltransferase [Halioglobus sp.]|nr:16S rRNA (uracil(1498)-N(3))-methyltransferase [Halioglobus sp.]